MARKKKRRRRKSKQVSALTIFGFASNFWRKAPSGNFIANRIQGGDWQGAVYDAREIFLGIDANGKIQLDWLINTWSRPIIGWVMSKVATKIGLNAQMARLPVVGKYLKL